LFAITACSDYEFPGPQNEEFDGLGTPTKLGKMKEIAWTVENMQKAFDNIVDNHSVTKQNRYKHLKTSQLQSPIQTTHYYLRFLAKDTAQQIALYADSILNVTEIPYEAEIEVQGSYYHDPELKDYPFTYLYSLCPVGYDLPEGFEYIKIADLYFPPEEINDEPQMGFGKGLSQTISSIKAWQLDEDFLNILEFEANRLTNNLSSEQLDQIKYYNTKNNRKTKTDVDYDLLKSNGILARNWSGSGVIRVQEDALSSAHGPYSWPNTVIGGQVYFPLQFAKINVRKWGWLAINTLTVDGNGRYSFTTRTKNVSYKLFLEDRYGGKDFQIQAGHEYTPATFVTGNFYRSGWNQNFVETDEFHFYALVHNATFDFYNIKGVQHGLHYPKFRKLTCKRWFSSASKHANDLAGIVMPTLTITMGTQGVYRGSIGVYGVVVHEIMHRSHYEMDNSMFATISHGKKDKYLIRESWAEGVSVHITNQRYGQLAPNYLGSAIAGYRYRQFYQTDGIADFEAYSPFVLDLMDNYNQSVSNSASNGPHFDDAVSGYTLSEIQWGINDQITIGDIGQRLKQIKPSGVTDNEIDNLIDDYETIAERL
jgi:hypothetical protein